MGNNFLFLFLNKFFCYVIFIISMIKRIYLVLKKKNFFFIEIYKFGKNVIFDLKKILFVFEINEF